MTYPQPEQHERYVTKREPFGRWLVGQRGRGDWVDGLADAARADRGFPKDGDVEAVRGRLAQLGADPDAFEALDDAELDWLAL